MRLRIDIKRKDGLSDPEGLTTTRALLDLGYETVEEVHFGRTIYIDVDEGDRDLAIARVTEMCERLLANPVIEDFELEVVG